MKHPIEETPRKAYIRILKSFAEARQNDAVAVDPSDLRLIVELAGAGYVNVHVNTDHLNRPVNCRFIAMSVSGRAFLQQLEKDEYEESFKGRAMKLVTFLGGAVFGFFLDFLKGWVLEK